SITIDQRRCCLWSKTGNSRKTIRRITNQSEIVRNKLRRHTKLCSHGFRATNRTTAPINLYHTLIDDALRQIFVRGPNANLLHSLVLCGEVRGSGERIVCLELNLGPHNHAHRDERFFEWSKLCLQCRFDACAGFVTRPQIVTKRFDDVVRGHTNMRRAVLEQLRHRRQHTRYGAERRISLLKAPYAVEVSKEFVCAVQQMNDHCP